MNHYADSSNRAASGKNNQSSFAIHYAKLALRSLDVVEASRIRKASEYKPTNNEAPTLLEAYKRLSRRECEVLAKIEEDKSSREIADELFISKKTVENHITNIGKKLKLKGRGRLRKWIRSQE